MWEEVVLPHNRTRVNKTMFRFRVNKTMLRFKGNKMTIQFIPLVKIRDLMT